MNTHYTYELIEPYRYTTSRWTGGATTELYILPEGASYAQRDFTARISSATVEMERSCFTPLPGVMRYISPLESRFTLCVEGAENVTLSPGEVYAFEGGKRVECMGTGRDINLMLRGSEGSMEYVQQAELTDGWLYFVYASTGVSLMLDGAPIGLPGGYLLRLTAARGSLIKLEASSGVYLMKVARTGR